MYVSSSTSLTSFGMAKAVLRISTPDHLDYYGRTDDKHKDEDKQADKEFDDKFHKFSLVVQILQEWKQPVKFTHKKKQMYEKNYFKRSLQTVFGLSVALHP